VHIKNQSHRLPRQNHFTATAKSIVFNYFMLCDLAMSEKTKGSDDPIEIKKSSIDTREYLGFEMDNGLTILLINDPGTDKSAVSLSVAAGKF